MKSYDEVTMHRSWRLQDVHMDGLSKIREDMRCNLLMARSEGVAKVGGRRAVGYSCKMQVQVVHFKKHVVLCRGHQADM